MKGASRVAYGLLCLAVPDACTRDGLKGRADGGNAPDGVVLDGAPGVVVDAAPIAGRRSFVVRSTIFPEGDGGAIFPGVHTFTMVLDWDRRTALVGASDGGSSTSFQATATGGTLMPLYYTFNYGSGSSVAYEWIEVAVDSSGALSGSGRGFAFYTPSNSDVASRRPATMSLAGVPDTIPPRFAANVSSTTPIDPLSLLVLSASEPIPPQTQLTVVGLRGDRVDLVPQSVTPLPGNDQQLAAFSFEPVPSRMWRYDEQYTIVLGGILDFTGNAAPAGAAITFTTTPAPPRALEDGFESATGATFAGAQLLSGTDAPTISGARSLYIPPLADAFPPGRSEIIQLALRLALDPTDTVVRFSYRLVNPNPARQQSDPIFGVGTEGGTIHFADLPPYNGPTTTSMIPGQGQVVLGPVTTGSVALPHNTPSTAGELILIRKVPACCQGQLAPPVPGIIIDDLRAE